MPKKLKRKGKEKLLMDICIQPDHSGISHTHICICIYAPVPKSHHQRFTKGETNEGTKKKSVAYLNCPSFRFLSFVALLYASHYRICPLQIFNINIYSPRSERSLHSQLRTKGWSSDPFYHSFIHPSICPIYLSILFVCNYKDFPGGFPASARQGWCPVCHIWAVQVR